MPESRNHPAIEDSYRKLNARIAELEAERDALDAENTEQADQIRRHIALRDAGDAENTALRKALEDAPHEAHCPVWSYATDSLGRKIERGPCRCWKAQIPEAKL